MAYKEIVTKAVIAKGKKKYKNSYTVEVSEEPSTILGCWIINHNFKAQEDNNIVTINGTFDVNIWYSYDNDTKTMVVNKQIDYTEKEKLDVPNSEVTNKSVIVRALEQPTCTSAKEDGKNINIEVEKELGIEIVGDTKVRISSVDEENDDWVDLDSSQLETDKINTNYINGEIIK